MIPSRTEDREVGVRIVGSVSASVGKVNGVGEKIDVTSAQNDKNDVKLL